MCIYLNLMILIKIIRGFISIRLRRRAHNRFGFALQLCVLRYPGRVLAPGELIPAEVIEFIGAQLGLGADDLVDYAAR